MRSFSRVLLRDEVLILFKQAKLSSSQKSQTPTISARYSYSRSHIMHSISNNYLVSMESSTKSDNDKTYFSSLTDRTYDSIMTVSHSFVILLYWPSSSLNWLCNCIPLDFSCYIVYCCDDSNRRKLMSTVRRKWKSWGNQYKQIFNQITNFWVESGK